MYIGTIGKTQAHVLASRLERLANESGKNTLTSVKSNRYVIRAARDDGKYEKTMLEYSADGIVQRAFSQLHNNSSKLIERIKKLYK